MLTDPEQDYAHGFVPFLGTTIYLDSRPLIPRTETEHWVEKAIREIYNTAVNCSIIRVLDLCAGSGAIGIAVLKHAPNTHVTFGEIEERHFSTIRKSLAANDIDAVRATFARTDVWSELSGPFDFILSNPPYISKERGTASASVATFEPPEALFAENDGFFYIQKILEGLPSHLAPGGVCFIEHEPFHVSRIAATSPYGVQSLPDQYGVVRYSRIEKKAMAY